MRRLAALLAALLVGSTLAAVPVAAAGETTIDHDGDVVTLSAGPQQEISGQTDLDPGTEVSVRVSINEGSPLLLQQQSATVQEDGTFGATVDLHQAEPGSTGNVSVVADGEEVARTPLAVTACDGDCAPVQTDAPEAESPFAFDGESITLSAGPEQHLGGQTDLATGTEVTVRLQSTDSASPFLRRATTTVDEDGRFAVTFNLTAVAAGTDARAILRANGESIGETSIDIESCDDSCAAAAAGETTGPSLSSSIVQVANGEATTLTIDYGSADRATLSIHSDGADGEPTWEVVATVEDTDDDGTATVTVDTDAVDADAPVLTADDELTVTAESTLSDDSLDPAAYDITLDSGATIDDEPTDIGTFSLTAGDGGSATATPNGADAGRDTGDDRTTDTPAEDSGMADAGLLGGGVLGLLTLFGICSRLLG